MKVTGIISALIFAHVAMGQASDSTSAAVSNTASVSGTKSANSAPASTKTGTKSASSSSSAPDATPTGSTSSIGSLTETVTGDSNPLIPADISAGCSTFLNSMNSNTTLSSCLASLNTALSSFTSGPGSASAVSKTITSLCSSNSCSSSTIRSKLTEFKDACPDELTSSNEMVVKQYEVWYSLIPFKSAICAKDNDQYCLLNTSSSSNTSNTRRSNAGLVRRLAKAIGRRAQTVLTPDLNAFRSQNIMYLGVSPDLDKEQLCTPCAQQILSKYVAWETATPHALGVTKSTLLGGQSQLWAAMQEKCPADFTTKITTDAGVPNPDDLAGSAVTTTASYFTALAAAFAAAFALF